MSRIVHCPYCGAAIDAAEAIRGDEYAEREGEAIGIGCPKCGGHLDIECGLIWTYEVLRPAGMEDCEPCPFWDVWHDACGFERYEGWCGHEPLRGCPLGYGGE